MSATLNHIFNEKWADREDSNVIHQLYHEKGVVAIPAEIEKIEVDVSDPDGLIVVRKGRQKKEFANEKEAAESALTQFFNSD
mgnify:CR=1 FL=1